MAKRHRPEAPQLGGERRNRLIREREHDTYKVRSKLPDPSACPQCGAMYRNGRWTWDVPPPDAHAALCPACHRIRDDHPGGVLFLDGDFLRRHHEEILGLARNVAERERGEHPLKRIMRVEGGEAGIAVATTDSDLARAIGEAVHHAYQGELTYRYTGEEDFLRVHWTR